MKAILLAAGKGTRLRPLTDTVPKCLIPICGVPLLGIWLDLLKKHGIAEVLINTHYHASLVEEFLAGDSSGVKVKAVYEEILLGSAGTIKANRGFVEGEDAFLIAYADNLTNMDITGMVEFHRSKGASFTMGLHRATNPKACGIATLNGDGLVTSFIEKPEHPESDLANAGVYVSGQEIFDYIPERAGVVDIGFDVLPSMVKRMYGYKIEEYLLDIGTLENYERANKEWGEQ